MKRLCFLTNKLKLADSKTKTNTEDERMLIFKGVLLKTERNSII